jgi:uncharacterized protein YcbK (DUF882 family)
MKLTENFQKIEFDSNDGAKMPKEVLANIKRLAIQLQILRGELGQSIHINSGYRSPKHNASIGGVKNSFHTQGLAADITSKNYTPKKLYKVIQALIKEGKMEEGGIGLYNGFIHYDIRGKEGRWDNSPWYNFW